MRLAETLAAMAPLLAGRTPPEETAQAFGVPAPGLALYAKLARMARISLLDGMFPHCRHALVERRGTGGWHAIVEAYFEAHAELRFVRHANAGAFPSFVRKRDDVPAWIGELADLEWHEWRAEIAAREASDDDPDGGPIRVTSTLVLASYTHDVVSWIDERGREGDPEPAPIRCAFWQDREAVSYRNALSDAHVAAIEAVRAGRAADAEAIAELRAADIVLGAASERSS